MEFFTSYTGTDFLLFYGGLLLLSVVAGVWIPAFLREAGTPSVPSNADEIAVLAGGANRHTDAVLTELFAADALVSDGKVKLRVREGATASTAAGQAVLREIGAFKLSHAKAAIAKHSENIEQNLVRRGLLLDQGGRLSLRVLSVLPYAVLLALGLYRWRAGNLEGEPTGFLVFLLVATAFLALIRLAKFNPRTASGDEALRDLEERSSRLKSGPTPQEAGLAVGIFGTAVLVGTPWEPVHAMRQQASGGDSGSSSDGDGGGCGGGCGGCGG